MRAAMFWKDIDHVVAMLGVDAQWVAKLTEHLGLPGPDQCGLFHLPTIEEWRLRQADRGARGARFLKEVLWFRGVS